jgi:hypothetical protein
VVQPIPKTAAQLYGHIRSSGIYAAWHWLRYNFDAVQTGGPEAAFGLRTLEALAACDGAMPGFGLDMIDRLASFGGTDHNMDDYERIRQWLGELLVIHHFVIWKWPDEAKFEHEPRAVAGGANPEVAVAVGELRLGIEVKTPDLRQHIAARNSNPLQSNSRTGIKGSDVTAPRDNPIKDFLIHAEKKFSGFRGDENFYSLLVIVWDDYVNEPIAALTSKTSGLLTEASFAVDRLTGKPLVFTSVDAVVLLRHQHQLRRGMANWPPIDDRDHFLDYGRLGTFPPNVILAVPGSRALPQLFTDASQASPPDPTMGAEYMGGDVVFWNDV